MTPIRADMFWSEWVVELGMTHNSAANVRDMLEEARSWREHLHPNSPLVAPLVGVTDRVLETCYRAWWQVYSEGIRSAPTNRSDRGVSARDATNAGESATTTVLALLVA